MDKSILNCLGDEVKRLQAHTHALTYSMTAIALEIKRIIKVQLHRLSFNGSAAV